MQKADKGMIQIKNICYIVGASSESSDISFNIKTSDIVIAADGGYDLLKKANIEADVLIGDFDSVASSLNHSCIIKHPVEKDDTDSFLAYKLGYEKGYRTFVIYGGTGGRTDHTIANIQMLSHMAKNDARGFLIGENTIITAIHNAKISFTGENNGKLGVFAHGNAANGVNIRGVKYTLEDGHISPDFPIGVSNEFIGTNATISVSDGTLILIWYENEKEFLKKINIYLEDIYDN